jgi:2-iminobutanoate/2-iminopropanoate deaminase
VVPGFFHVRGGCASIPNGPILYQPHRLSLLSHHQQLSRVQRFCAKNATIPSSTAIQEVPVRQVIATTQGPKAIGPYSQAIKANGLIFLSGQIPLDPATQQLISGDVAAQTERVLQNITAILRAGGASLAQVVKTTVFLKSMNDFAAMNAVYERHFTADPPARSTVEVSRLPKDALVEIDVIALTV